MAEVLLVNVSVAVAVRELLVLTDIDSVRESEADALAVTEAVTLAVGDGVPRDEVRVTVRDSVSVDDNDGVAVFVTLAELVAVSVAD